MTMVIVSEFREAWRRLRKRPGYALLSIVVMGVGLGLAMFLFTGINSMVLQPLPFPHADRLVVIGEPGSNVVEDMDSDQYLRLKGRLNSVDTLGAMMVTGANLDIGGGASFEHASRMTAAMMHLVGVKPILGRTLRAADDARDAPPVVVIGQSLWQQTFHADAHIIGRQVRVNGQWATVVGVLPTGFTFPFMSRLWLPLHLQPGQHRDVGVFGQLAPGVPLSQARSELDAWKARLQRVLPSGRHARALVVAPMAAGLMPRDLLRWMWLMFGAAVMVLALACINVANLELVQTLQRRHELALRSALGSSQARLVLGPLTESLLLGTGALMLAFPIAWGGVTWLHDTWISAHPAQGLYVRGIDGWVIAFGIMLALVSTLLAGGIPAWRAARADLQGTLRDGGKGSGRGFARVARAMTVFEVALTVVLLVGAGMFVRAVDQLLAQPSVGTAQATHVLTANVSLPATGYASDARRIAFFHEVVTELRRDAGVADATASNSVPGAQLGSHEDVSLPGRGRPNAGWPRAQMAIAGPHFLATYGVKLLQGRFFDARDDADSRRVVVVDARMAEQFWPHGNPLGRTLVLYPGKPYAENLTVVGVVQTLQLADALEPARPSVLIPLSQASGASPLHRVGLALRTHAPAAAFQRRLAAAVHAVDPQAAIYNVTTQAQLRKVSRLGLVVLTDVFSAVGLIALLLAAAGLYGVLAFSVAQRTRELGIRRAIGAGNGAIVRTVAQQLAWQLGLGLLIGLVLAVPWSGILADPGLHTQAHDLGVFVPVLLVVIGASFVAALVPTVRALRVDPGEALRYE
jgi:predicted permease